MSKEDKDKVSSEELEDERPEDEPLMSDPKEEVTELTATEEVTTVTGGDLETIEVTAEPETEEKAKEDTEPQEPPVEDESEPEPWPPFKNMPGSKKPEGLTVRERVPQLKDKVLKLYKRMRRGQRLTEKQFAKKLKLKDPKDIQAAGIAWHFLRDEKKIAGEQFYKPLVKE